MDLQPCAADAASRLEPMLIRLPPPLAQRLRDLARATRIRQSEYLREAVADLLDKYAHVERSSGSPTAGEPGGPARQSANGGGS